LVQPIAASPATITKGNAMSSSVICRPAFGNPKNRKRPDCDLAWRRDGADWVLLNKRRRMGWVLPDNQHRGMYRSVLSRGRLSDMANLFSTIVHARASRRLVRALHWRR